MIERSTHSNAPTIAKSLPQRIGYGLLWAGFSLYAFFLAPPNQPDTVELIQRLSQFDVAGINPLVVYLFNLMGVLPMMYSCTLYADGHGQKLPAWPFVVGSFFLGAFALLPYFGLRQPNPQFRGQQNWYLRIWDSRVTAILVVIAAIVCLFLGLTQGDWSDFLQQWRSDRFIHVMSLDFCLLSLLFPALIPDDMARRGMRSRYFWWFAAVPLFGPLVYLLIRPPITITEASE